MSLLKLIAIVPPEPLYSEIRKEQEYVAQTWGPIYALRSPPHITIIPPLALTSSEIGFLFGIADAIAYQTEPFNIVLNKFGAFNPRVIFIRPLIPVALENLYAIWHEAILSKMPHVLEKYPDRPYHPHLTLAHKDVKRDQFEQMWPYYETKKFNASFDVDHFCILTHAENGWEVEGRFYFGGV